MRRILDNLGLNKKSNANIEINPSDLYFKSMAELIGSIQKVKGKDGVDGKQGKSGRDGKDGKTPIKGIDYLTPDEIRSIKESIKPLKNIDYFDGKDGRDGKDGEIKTIQEIVEKKVPLSQQDIELIARSLELLSPDKKLDIKAIKDWEATIISVVNKTIRKRAGAGGTTGGNGNDVNAIHTNEANEISGLTEKVTPANGDLIVIESSTDGFAKRKVQIGNLPSSGGGAVSSIIAGDGISVDVGTGNVTVTNSDRGSTAVATHVGESDPHTQYVKKELAIAYAIAL